MRPHKTAGNFLGHPKDKGDPLQTAEAFEYTIQGFYSACMGSVCPSIHHHSPIISFSSVQVHVGLYSILHIFLLPIRYFFLLDC